LVDILRVTYIMTGQPTLRGLGSYCVIGRKDVYAVIKSGAHQYKASVGDELIVERLPYEVGAQVELNEVYLLADEEGVSVGQPVVDGAMVRATVLEEFRGPKIRIFKYKPKERYRRRMGHRQTYMRLRIDEIVKGA
jgi:large subunit ribosomal protein L21